jgi:hypothetical protein
MCLLFGIMLGYALAHFESVLRDRPARRDKRRNGDRPVPMPDEAVHPMEYR